MAIFFTYSCAKIVHRFLKIIFARVQLLRSSTRSLQERIGLLLNETIDNSLNQRNYFERAEHEPPVAVDWIISRLHFFRMVGSTDCEDPPGPHHEPDCVFARTKEVHMCWNSRVFRKPPNFSEYTPARWLQVGRPFFVRILRPISSTKWGVSKWTMTGVHGRSHQIEELF